MKKIILLFLITFSNNVSAQIDRMEPPFWYEGMNKSEVQVLFYGKNIAQNSVQVSNNIVITNITKTENPNYLFVTIVITTDRKSTRLNSSHNRESRMPSSA